MRRGSRENRTELRTMFRSQRPPLPSFGNLLRQKRFGGPESTSEGRPGPLLVRAGLADSRSGDPTVEVLRKFERCGIDWRVEGAGKFRFIGRWRVWWKRI